mmetsp:Transcript_52790/g.60660  ORF Transcript_52790/g.60660 Transcript_52790/m.60660 type:complete len:89 (-) Transcript_52790:66-332(-)
MIIIVEFADDISNVERGTKTSVDIEWSESVENLKVHITLKYGDLDPAAFDLYYQGRKIRPSQKVNAFGYQEGTNVIVRRAKSEMCVCI